MNEQTNIPQNPQLPNNPMFNMDTLNIFLKREGLENIDLEAEKILIDKKESRLSSNKRKTVLNILVIKKLLEEQAKAKESKAQTTEEVVAETEVETTESVEA